MSIGRGSYTIEEFIAVMDTSDAIFELRTGCDNSLKKVCLNFIINLCCNADDRDLYDICYTEGLLESFNVALMEDWITPELVKHTIGIIERLLIMSDKDNMLENTMKLLFENNIHISLEKIIESHSYSEEIITLSENIYDNYFFSRMEE